MADQLGRFGMAIALIGLIAAGLYQFSGRVYVAGPVYVAHSTK